MGWGELERTPLADYGIFQVVRKRAISPRTAQPVTFHTIASADWVQVVPVAADGRLVMVEQFRPGPEMPSLEFPAGLVDADEAPEAAAARELAEETGFRTVQLIHLGSVYPNPAINENQLHVWLALECEPAGPLEPDEGEDIRVHLIAHDDFERLRSRGEIHHALVITAWHLYGVWRSQRSASRT